MKIAIIKYIIFFGLSIKLVIHLPIQLNIFDKYDF